MKPNRSVARSFAVAAALLCLVLVGSVGEEAAAQPKPEGEMRWALYVTLSPTWFDPAESLRVSPRSGCSMPSTTRWSSPCPAI